MKSRIDSQGSTSAAQMRAVTVPRYGGPDVLRVTDIRRPVPGEGEVLVRVAWGAINAADCRLMQADPWMVRLAFGLRRPRFAALGIAMAGTVVESNVESLPPGTRVAGDLSAVGCGAFAEYVCVAGEVLAPVPTGVELDTAATLPLAGTTALQALRIHAGIQPGHRVIVTGASGAVGSIAVVLSRYLGAEVWAVTSAGGRELVEQLEPYRIIDRTETDIMDDPDIPDHAFDAIIDTGGYRSIFDYRRVLSTHGTYVHVGGSMRYLAQTAIAGSLRSTRDGTKWKTFTATADVADLSELLQLASDKEIVPVIGSRFPLGDAAAAMHHAVGHKTPGRVLIDVE